MTIDRDPETLQARQIGKPVADQIRGAAQGFQGRLAPKLAAGKLLAAQTCYRPIVRYSLPLIGRVPGVAQAYVATGHSVWGMQNGPQAIRTADPRVARPPRPTK